MKIESYHILIKYNFSYKISLKTQQIPLIAFISLHFYPFSIMQPNKIKCCFLSCFFSLLFLPFIFYKNKESVRPWLNERKIEENKMKEKKILKFSLKKCVKKILKILRLKIILTSTVTFLFFFLLFLSFESKQVKFMNFKIFFHFSFLFSHLNRR